MDLDGDGHRDVITGSWPGRIYWFEASGTGTFARGRSLRHEDGSEIEPGRASAPFAADWNGDGRVDLVVGNIAGAVEWLPGLGGEGAPAFGPAAPIEVAGQALGVGNDAAPVVADWDGDGCADLLVGDGYGGVQWFRNTGTAGRPVLAAAGELIPRPQGGRRGDSGVPPRGTRAKFCVTDWNEDGRLDLLVGEFGSGVDAGGAPRDAAEAAELSRSSSALAAEIAAAERVPVGESGVDREARLLRRDALCAEWVQIDQKVSMSGSTWLGRVWLFEREGTPGRERK